MSRRASEHLDQACRTLPRLPVSPKIESASLDREPEYNSHARGCRWLDTINSSGNKIPVYPEKLEYIAHCTAPIKIGFGDGKTYRVQSFIHTSFLKPISYLLTANSPFGSFLHSGHSHSPAGSFLSPTQVQWNH